MAARFDWPEVTWYPCQGRVPPLSLSLSRRATLSRGARESVLSASESQNDIVIDRYKTSHLTLLRCVAAARYGGILLLWRKYCCEGGEVEGGAHVPPLNFFYWHKLLPSLYIKRLRKIDGSQCNRSIRSISLFKKN